MILETARLWTRHYNEEDSDLFFSINGNIDIMRYIRNVKSREESDAFFREVLQYGKENPLYGRWPVFQKTTDLFVGSFALIPVEHTNDMQLGYALLPEHWGKGYATELTKAGIDYVFTKTSLTEIFAYTDPANTASQNVLLKSGFHAKGEVQQGEMISSAFYLSKAEYESRRQALDQLNLGSTPV